MNSNDLICILTPFPPPTGGISSWSILISDFINKNCFKNIIFYNTSMRKRNYHIRNTLLIAILNCFAIIKQFYDIYKLFFEKKVFTFHCCTTGGRSSYRDIYVSLLAKIFNRQVILHMHFGKSVNLYSESTLQSLLFKISIKLANKLIFIDKKSYDYFVSALPRKNIYILPNCINANNNTFSSKKEKKIVFAGNVIKSKGIEELLTAWQNIDKRDWQLEIYGSCDDKYLTHLIKSYKIDNVSFYGQISRNELMSKLSIASILILPSHTEGFPYVVLEAMDSCCAVIATSVGAIPEILDTSTGIVIPPKDSPSIENSLNQLISNPKKITQLGMNAAVIVREKYSVDSIFPQLQKIWISNL